MSLKRFLRTLLHYVHSPANFLKKKHFRAKLKIESPIKNQNPCQNMQVVSIKSTVFTSLLIITVGNYCRYCSFHITVDNAATFLVSRIFFCNLQGIDLRTDMMPHFVKDFPWKKIRSKISSMWEYLFEIVWDCIWNFLFWSFASLILRSDGKVVW